MLNIDQINYSNNEIQPLISASKNIFLKRENIESIFKHIKILVDGAVKVYIGFKPLAMESIPGWWILGPICAGAAINLAAKMVESFTPPYSTSSRIMNLVRLVSVECFKEIGFLQHMIKITALTFDNTANSSEAFKVVIFPTLTAFLAMIPSYSDGYLARVKMTAPKNGKPKIRLQPAEIFTNTMRSATASAFAFSILQERYVLKKPYSVLPVITFLVTGILGFMAGILEISHPRISQKINFLIKSIVENASLAIGLLDILNSAYAKNHHNDLPDGFVVLTAIFAGLYFVLTFRLLWVDLKTNLAKQDQLDAAARFELIFA